MARIAEPNEFYDRIPGPPNLAACRGDAERAAGGRDHRAELSQRTAAIRPGTLLSREWNGRMRRVAVLADGFAWNGKTYQSLWQVAFAITGTR